MKQTLKIGIIGAAGFTEINGKPDFNRELELGIITLNWRLFASIRG